MIVMAHKIFDYFPILSMYATCVFFIFLHKIPNMVPWMNSMIHNLSIECYCAPKKLLSKELFPMEVKWCQDYTLNYFSCNILIRVYFAFGIARWKALVELFHLSCKGFLYKMHTHFSYF
jgi:hypothetical protein